MDVYVIVFDGTRWSKPRLLLDGSTDSYKDIDLPQISSVPAVADRDVFGTYRTNTARQERDPRTGAVRQFEAGTQHLFRFDKTGKLSDAFPVWAYDSVATKNVSWPRSETSGKLLTYDETIMSLYYKEQGSGNHMSCDYEKGASLADDYFVGPSQLATGITTTYPPAVAKYRGYTHVFVGERGTSLIRHFTSDPATPMALAEVEPILTPRRMPAGLVASAVYQGAIHIAYYAEDLTAKKRSLFLQKHAGSWVESPGHRGSWKYTNDTWSQPVVAGEGCSPKAMRPSISVLNGLLYCFYIKLREGEPHPDLVYSTYDGNSTSSLSYDPIGTSVQMGDHHDTDSAVRVSTVSDPETKIKSTTALLYCIYQATSVTTDSNESGKRPPYFPTRMPSPPHLPK
ncbi:hypothetical protein [Mycobacteroides abscessus]|uniref:hypothetical protein n=1 Tax=Mycobacteroides abscessus TaxID=36809 RepID=UPI000D3EA960|nr:hypothetical protein [Mycobacteroides abscessus]PVB33011.1 hypothetical protein DDJ45_10270 [Mycobacteroides abscessus]